MWLISMSVTLATDMLGTAASYTMELAWHTKGYKECTIFGHWRHKKLFIFYKNKEFCTNMYNEVQNIASVMRIWYLLIYIFDFFFANYINTNIKSSINKRMSPRAISNWQFQSHTVFYLFIFCYTNLSSLYRWIYLYFKIYIQVFFVRSVKQPVRWTNSHFVVQFRVFNNKNNNYKKWGWKHSFLKQTYHMPYDCVIVLNNKVQDRWSEI